MASRSSGFVPPMAGSHYNSTERLAMGNGPPMYARRLLLVMFGPAVLALGGVAPLRADTFELKDGGQVVGVAIGPPSDDGYVVKTADGAEVTIGRDLISRVVKEDAALAEYQARSRRMPDTAAAHRELAAWCRDQKLSEQAKVHLARVAELDPNDEEARRSLGYQRVGQRWLTSDQIMADRGMVFYEGKYRTKQDIAIRERNKEEEAANIDWFTKLRLWRGWLNNKRPERAAEAQALITAVSDPAAAPALVKILSDEDDPDVFEMLLAVLARLDHPATVQTLVELTLDPEISAETRDQALEYLVEGPGPVSIIPYVQALKSKDNKVVNRAGHALGRIGDPAAISPMIDALVTSHKYVIQPEGPAGGTALNPTFSPSGGGGGLSVGGNGPKIIQRDEQNERVLQGLIKLSGKQNFEYDEQAWRAWYVDMQMRQRYHARRDD
jgi:hypothetical protein